MKYCGKCNRTYSGAQTLCPVDGEKLTLKDLYGFVGQLIAGKYMVHELTNIGGMSAVYLAQQIGVDRRVAFKILLPNVAASNANLARLFEREAKTAGKLSHENIATIYDAGHTSEGVPYIVMEWLDGHTLEQEIMSGQPMPLERVAYLLRQIAAAIDAAHNKRVIHRDLKPGNIMLVKRADGRDQVKVVDFGLAKVSNQTGDLQVSEAVGTPNYASPEQFQTGAEIDPRTDIYSLGIMLYQMLTGHLPFHATTIAEAVRAHLLETPRPVTHFRPELPDEIEMIVNRMLAKTPHYRPAQATEVAHVFDWVVANLRGETALATYEQPTQRVMAARMLSSQSPEAFDDEPAYSLDDLFRPVYDQTPSFGESFVPRTLDDFNARSSGAPTPSSGAWRSGQAHPLRTSAAAQWQPAPSASAQARMRNSHGTRPTAIISSTHPSVINPAVGLSLPLLGNLPLPGSRRQQIMALLAIVLSVGLCFTLFRLRGSERALEAEKDIVLLGEFVNRSGDAVFDGALQQALSVQLGQTPYLTLFAEEKIKEGLRFMGRQPGEPLTRNLAHELCKRYGLKALIIGEITQSGSGGYKIKLQALHGQTKDVIAESGAEAKSKAEVLNALGRAAQSLRSALGESLTTIQKFNAPIEQATTKSLDALQAFTQGRRITNWQDKPDEAIALYEKAIQFDPEFALAHNGLAVTWINEGETARALAAATKAFQLSPRVSERERLTINGFYFLVTGEIEHAIETYKLMVQTYPRNVTPLINLSVCYNRLGLLEAALAAAQEAMNLDPANVMAYQNAADLLIRLNRYAEAERLIAQAHERKLDGVNFHFNLFQLGVLRHDTALMQQQLDWMKGQPEEFRVYGWRAAAAAYRGQFRESAALAQQARNEAQARRKPDVAAALAMSEAWRAALIGDKTQAQNLLRASLAESRKSYTQLSVSRAAPFGPLMLALAGAAPEAQACADELAQQNPKNTLANAIWLPLARAALALHEKQPARALALLESVSGYEQSAHFYPAWLRGHAYLALGKPAEAVAAFDFILQHRGYDPSSVLYPLAHLQIARAYAQQNRAVQSRKYYADFLAFWKEADADQPLLLAARAELATLK
jgi:serine/threonine protein kinase/tetratricopeptide (TPR) repeat protein